jgi:hypothetical protein
MADMPRILLVFVGVLYDCSVSAMGIPPNEGGASLNLIIDVMCLMSWTRPKARYFIYVVHFCTSEAAIFVDSSPGPRAISTKMQSMDTETTIVIVFLAKYGI